MGIRSTSPSRLLSAAEAAEYLGITRRALRRLVRAGELAYVRRGRHLGFRLDDLDAALPPSPARVFLRGVALGAVAVALLGWARRAILRMDPPEGGRDHRRPAAALRAARVDRRSQLLTEFHSLLKSHYATTRFMAALLVLQNRRVADRRQVNIPVAVERRSGRDRRATANIDAEVEEWRQRLAAAARSNRN